MNPFAVSGLGARPLLSQSRIGLLLSLAILFTLFAPLFYSDYAYLDEAFQLWHKWDGSNYGIFFLQGRWLTGLLLNKLMADIPTISGLKIMRLLSLFSWALFLEEYFRLGKVWQRLIGFEPLLLSLGGVYIACSLPVAIYIGWGSCFQAGAASLLGLWSGHLLFGSLLSGQGRVSGQRGDAEQGRVPGRDRVSVSGLRMLLIIGAALCSLFLYQIAFGTFLIPLALYMTEKRSSAAFRILATGAASYLFILLLYYLLFRYSLRFAGVMASDRANLSTDIPGKLAFFFSLPLSQAFSFNLLVNLHSVISQALPILVMAGWVILYLRTDKNRAVKKIAHILAVLALGLLIYAPVLAARENFASYRTMFALNLAITLMILDVCLRTIKSMRRARGGSMRPGGGGLPSTLFAGAFLCCCVGIGIRNFRINFLDPLKEEYRVLNEYFQGAYRPAIGLAVGPATGQAIRQIYFLRPPETLFFLAFHVNPYKDEFGVPSTYKDWTPEPLLKELIFEKTGDRALAERTAIISFADKAAYEAASVSKRPDTLCIDMESLFGHPAPVDH